MISEAIAVEGVEFCGIRIATEHAAILLLQGRRANLGCGYFSLTPAEKLGDRFAIVTGVKDFADMLDAAVIKASPAATACGVTAGMSGREALLCMECR